MKIMCLTEAYTPDINVGAIRIQEMVAVFAQQKDTSVTVLVYNPQVNSKTSGRTAQQSGSVTIIRQEHRHLSRMLRVAQLVGILTVAYWVYLLLKEARRNKPDIVVASIPGLAPAAAAYLVSKALGFTICIDIRDDWLAPKFKNFVIRQLPWYAKLYGRLSYELSFLLFLQACKKALLVSAVYATILDGLKKIPGYRAPAIYVPNGVNLGEIGAIASPNRNKGAFAKYGILDDGAKTIIFVGMLGGYYHPDALIPALKQVNENGIRLNYVVVGEGVLKNKIKADAEKEGIGDHVFTPGNLVHREVIDLLRASDLAFYALDKDFPAADSALGVKILEYIACKLPILSISGEDAVVAQIIHDKGIGITLGWNELEHLGDAIRRMLEEDESTRHIEAYYPDFIATYDRRTNNQRLYDKMREAYGLKKGGK